MYEIFSMLLEKRNVKPADIAKATGIPPSTFSDWKAGRSEPKKEKLKKIADYLGVTVEYLDTGIETEQVYYINDEARDMAEFIFQNPDYKVLFDASRKVKKDDIEFVKNMIDRLSKNDESL